MIDLNQDLLDARAILEGRTLLQPTVAHLRALQVHHEDSQIVIAMLLAKLHDQVMEMP
jgi:hypothetical protein